MCAKVNQETDETYKRQKKVFIRGGKGGKIFLRKEADSASFYA